MCVCLILHFLISFFQIARFFVEVLNKLPSVSNALLVQIVKLIDENLVWGAMEVSTFSALLKCVLRAVHDIMATHESGVGLLDQLVAFCDPHMLKVSVTAQDIC